jgi:hypothetical protein
MADDNRLGRRRVYYIQIGRARGQTSFGATAAAASCFSFNKTSAASGTFSRISHGCSGGAHLITRVRHPPPRCGPNSGPRGIYLVKTKR